MSQFSFFEFTPREPFEQACRRWLNAVIERVPSDATCRASVTKVKNGYFFSVSIHCAAGSFLAETYLDEVTADRQRRDWQVIALGEMEEAMLKQIEKWMQSRRLEARSSPQGHADEFEFTRKAS